MLVGVDYLLLEAYDALKPHSQEHQLSICSQSQRTSLFAEPKSKKEVADAKKSKCAKKKRKQTLGIVFVCIVSGKH